MSAQEAIATNNENKDAEARFPVLSSDRKLATAQVAWIVMALFEAGLFALSIPARWDQLHNPSPKLKGALAEMGMSLSFFASFNVGLEALFAFSFSLVALIILA